MSAIIQTNRLTKSYGRSRGIIDVTFDIQEGEVFGFLGPNGAGKTTTMRTLMGLLRTNSGIATIGGLDCWTQSTEVKKIPVCAVRRSSSTLATCAAASTRHISAHW